MTQIVGATRNMDGVAHHASGSFTSDGTGADVNLGFRPRHVIVVNVTAVIRYEKIDGMTDTVKTITAGTTTIATGGQIVINQNGFSIADAALAASDLVSFVATS